MFGKTLPVLIAAVLFLTVCNPLQNEVEGATYKSLKVPHRSAMMKRQGHAHGPAMPVAPWSGSTRQLFDQFQVQGLRVKRRSDDAIENNLPHSRTGARPAAAGCCSCGDHLCCGSMCHGK